MTVCAIPSLFVHLIVVFAVIEMEEGLKAELVIYTSLAGGVKEESLFEQETNIIKNNAMVITRESRARQTVVNLFIILN